MQSSSNSTRDSSSKNVKTISLKGESNSTLPNQEELSSKNEDQSLQSQDPLSDDHVDDGVSGADLEANGSEDEDEDWLISDEEIQGNPSRASTLETLGDLSIVDSDHNAPNIHKVKGMADRDWERVEAQFKDAGYREGITAGKLSTLQAGFDSGFNAVGAPLGRRLGKLRGEAQAIKVFLQNSQSKDSSTLRSSGQAQLSVRKDASRSRMKKLDRSLGKFSANEEVLDSDSVQENSKAALELEIEDDHVVESTTNTSTIRPSSSVEPPPLSASKSKQVSQTNSTSTPGDVESPLRNLLILISDLNMINLDDLAPPDYEAMKHEKEHLEGRASEIKSSVEISENEDEDDGIVRESEEDRKKREDILPRLEERLEKIRQNALSS